MARITLLLCTPAGDRGPLASWRPHAGQFAYLGGLQARLVIYIMGRYAPGTPYRESRLES